MEYVGRRSSMRIPTGGSLFSTYASFTATYTLLRQAFYEFVPQSVRKYLVELFMRWFSRKPTPSPNLFTLIIEEQDNLKRNEIFDACQVYLCHKMSHSADLLKVCRALNEETMSFKLAKGMKFSDTFQGINLQWSFHYPDSSSSTSPAAPAPNARSLKNYNVNREKSFIFLATDKEHKDLVFNSYLPFVVETSKDIIQKAKQLKLCDCNRVNRANSGNTKISVNMTHPFTFDKLAIDPEIKKSIIDDLDRFVERKDYYRRVGKPWKRGYLLYGPPGTGKSSLIAAMANYLKFDIYDLQLAAGMQSESYLRDLLLWVPSKSIIVVEDIDCTRGLPSSRPISSRTMSTVNANKDPDQAKNEAQISLAALLNFVDGLWSCFGDERLIVFTTNHKDKLDPALVRPGRMDVHIHMSYLTMPAFKVLAHNYLQLSTDHSLFGEIESLLETVNSTPAEVAEEMMRSDDHDTALKGVIELLKRKKSEAQDTIISSG